MEFRIQEIFKNLLPGFAFVIIIYFVMNVNNIGLSNVKTPELVKDLSSVFLLLFLAAVYIIGYFIDSMASFLERRILYRIFPRPSYVLLNLKKTRYSISRREDVLENLCHKIRTTAPAIVDKELAKKLFIVANEIKDNNQSDVIKEKVSEYYNSYIFSRNFMMAIFFSLLVCLVNVFLTSDRCNMIYLFVIIFALCCISVFRWRSRAFYYSRQVLLASYY